MSSLQKNKSTQTSGSVFAERIEKAKKTKFELELIKIEDCFLDGHGSYDSKLVSFKNTLLQTIFICYSCRVFPKKTNYLLEMRFRIKKFQPLPDFFKKILQRVRF